MFLIDLNNILYVWTMHYDIFLHYVWKKCPYRIQKKILLCICGMEKIVYIRYIKSIIVYIAYGNFVHK